MFNNSETKYSVSDNFNLQDVKLKATVDGEEGLFSCIETYFNFTLLLL